MTLECPIIIVFGQTYDISLAKWTPLPWVSSDIWPTNPGQILAITDAERERVARWPSGERSLSLPTEHRRRRERASGPCTPVVAARFWDSVRIDRISPKFTHLGRVRTEFSASKFEYSQKSNRKPTEIDRNSPNSVGTEFFSKLNPKTLPLRHCQ